MILKSILNKFKRQCLGLAVVIFMTLFFGIDYFPSESAPFEARDNLVSSIAKLDFDKVDFWLVSDSEFRKRLSSLATEKLTSAGLYTKPYQGVPSSERIAVLKMTLNSYPLSEDISRKVMYQRRLELWETVVPVRNPDLKIDSVTWSYGPSRPEIRDPITLPELEEDLDRYLSEFIRSYRMGNPKKP